MYIYKLLRLLSKHLTFWIIPSHFAKNFNRNFIYRLKQTSVDLFDRIEFGRVKTNNEIDPKPYRSKYELLLNHRSKIVIKHSILA